MQKIQHNNFSKSKTKNENFLKKNDSIKEIYKRETVSNTNNSIKILEPQEQRKKIVLDIIQKEVSVPNQKNTTLKRIKSGHLIKKVEDLKTIVSTWSNQLNQSLSTNKNMHISIQKTEVDLMVNQMKSEYISNEKEKLKKEIEEIKKEKSEKEKDTIIIQGKIELVKHDIDDLKHNIRKIKMKIPIKEKEIKIIKSSIMLIHKQEKQFKVPLSQRKNKIKEREDELLNIVKEKYFDPSL